MLIFALAGNRSPRILLPPGDRIMPTAVDLFTPDTALPHDQFRLHPLLSRQIRLIGQQIQQQPRGALGDHFRFGVENCERHRQMGVHRRVTDADNGQILRDAPAQCPARCTTPQVAWLFQTMTPVTETGC
jgi:hypothetical protein